MSKTPGAPKVANLNDLLAVAYQIEIDAVDRYKLLADQMETHNNPDLVKIFRDLARAEGIQVLHKPIKPAALRALLAQWRVLRVAAAE